MKISIGKMNNMLEIRKEKYICSVCDGPRARFMCGRCHAVDYCSKDCQVKDLKRHKMVCAPAEMKAVDNRTRGIFATKDFKMGDLIFKVEADMCLKPGADPLFPGRDYIEIHKQRHMQADLQFTHMKGGGGTYLNSWNFTVLTHNKHCLFPLLCQFRHKCSSNATTNVVTDNQFLREVRAIKDIKKGEEVTINYFFTFPKKNELFPYLVKEERKSNLARVYDVVCECNHCVLGEDEDKIEELRSIKAELVYRNWEDEDSDDVKAQLQVNFVEKLRRTYLAPYLMPLECPLMVYHCFIAAELETALYGMDLWRDMIRRRNVIIFKEYSDRMLEILSIMGKKLSQKYDEGRGEGINDGHLKVFKDVLFDTENNLF